MPVISSEHRFLILQAMHTIVNSSESTYFDKTIHADGVDDPLSGYLTSDGWDMLVPTLMWRLRKMIVRDEMDGWKVG